MPDRASVIEARRTARKIESVAQIARRDIPYRVLLSRWTPRGLLERATLADLQAAGLPCFRQHIPNLTAFAKASFSGESPTMGPIGLALGKIVDELTEIGALKAKGCAA
jgi:chromosome partitioning protein